MLDLFDQAVGRGGERCTSDVVCASPEPQVVGETCGPAQSLAGLWLGIWRGRADMRISASEGSMGRGSLSGAVQTPFGRSKA